MKAKVTTIRISPKKASLIAWIVRWMDTERAVAILANIDKKWAWIVLKLLNSAIANAVTNFSQKKQELVISKIMVTPWPIYKRWQSRSKWRVFAIQKKTSNIYIELSIKEVIEDVEKETDKWESKAEEIKDTNKKDK